MMAERLAEIRDFANNRWLHGFDPGTVRELLDHIAQLDERVSTLLFTNGVLDSAAKDAQAWLCRAQTAEAKCAQLEAQRGGAVVVPELTEEILSLACGCAIPPSEGPDAIKFGLRSSLRSGYRNGWGDLASRIQPIPADRVLADGMVGVDRKGLQGVYEALAYSQPSEPSVVPRSNSMAHRRALGFCADALRSAKGEVEG